MGGRGRRELTGGTMEGRILILWIKNFQVLGDLLGLCVHSSEDNLISLTHFFIRKIFFG